MRQERSTGKSFKKVRVISAHLSPELDGHVENYRDMHKLSRADIVREALRHYFAVKQGRHAGSGV
ncbi:MAG: ribbon-helix-helix protein, CopG family [Verrucomicrobia bacterium]|nr:ribbon-helix-helix protein, CopG family [Verrucomicrobiota bacterium]